MTKLEFDISTSTWECVHCSPQTAQILACHGRPLVSSLVANLAEFQRLQSAVEQLLVQAKQTTTTAASSTSSHKPDYFTTLNLVFAAPNAIPFAGVSDRRPLPGVYASPIQAIHCCGELELACFVHLQLLDGDDIVHVTALEYARQHRQDWLRQEFGSWLLEQHIEKGVIATTLTGQVVFWNRHATRLYQYTAEQAVGHDILTLTPSNMTVQQGQEIMTNLQQGQHWTGMFKVKRKDQTEFMAHVTDTPIMDAAGQVKFIVGVSDDYTQLHTVLEKLEQLNADLDAQVQARTLQILQQETTLRMVGAAIQASDTGIIITNDCLRIVWSNQAAYRILGMNNNNNNSDLSSTSTSMVGSYPWELDVFEKSKHDSAQKLAKWLNESLTVHNTDTLMNTAETRLDVRDLDLPVVQAISITVQRLQPPGSQQNDHQNIITLRDLTAQQKADEAQLAAETAAATSEAKTEMMQMLSHELRTPLQGIMGIASTMLIDSDKPEDSSVFGGISTILACSRLLLTLINNVLNFRKMDAIGGAMMDHDQLELGPVSVVETVDQSIRYCQPFAMVNEINLVEENIVPLTVTSNRLRLEQILINLITNSVKYATPGTDVVVSTRRSTTQNALEEAQHAAGSSLRYTTTTTTTTTTDNHLESVIFSIRDHGRGIPDSEADKVFGKFMQLSISAEKEREHGTKGGQVGQPTGSGLGLNLVMKFVTAMGGHVWFNNCPTGGGVKFSFYLPASEQDTAQASHQPMDTRVGHVENLSPQDALRFRVLIVDDSVINVKVLSRMIKRLGVQQVETFYSGVTLLQYLSNLLPQKDAQLFPNLILSDLHMPELSGQELVAQVRQMNLPINPIVVACTADWTPGAEASCRSAGFDDILRKPIAIETLEAFLARMAVEKLNRLV